MKKKKPVSENKFSSLKMCRLKSLTSIILLIILLSSLVSCNQGNDQSTQAKPKTNPLVEVQAARESQMVSSIEITGTIEANIFTDIIAPADGILEVLHVRENQFVQKDKVIAVINPDERVALISDNYLKIHELESKLNGYKQDSKEYQNILEKLDQAKNDLEYAKNMYQPIPVICPMSGVVTQRWTDIGSQVSTKDKIITISDMSSLVVKARINEKYFEALMKGKELELTLNAYPNDSISGIINLIYPNIDPDDRTVEFDIKLKGFNKKILPGMMAFISVPVSVRDNTVSVPEHAVLTTPDNKNILFTVDSNNIAHRKTVVKGIESGMRVEINQGLTSGEKVVVSGHERLQDSVEVKILK